MGIDRHTEITYGVIDILKEFLSPLRIIAFGSRAKGNNQKNSDFDFAVDCPRPSLSMMRKIQKNIAKISGLYKVDIVYINSVDEEFKEIILNSGELLYERGT